MHRKFEYELRRKEVDMKIFKYVTYDIGGGKEFSSSDVLI